MEPLLPEQKNQLASWAEQRDEILRSIAEKRAEEERLASSVNDLSQTKTQIADEIQQSIGRLEELKKKEEEFKNLISKDVADLKEEKSVLQTEITSLQREIILHKQNRDEVVESVHTAADLFERVFGKAGTLENLIQGIIRIASDNARVVKETLDSAIQGMERIIHLNSENVEKTNKVIAEVPKIITDIHRDVIERRVIARNRLADNGVRPKD